MATIDKALPNVKQTLTIPGPEEVQEEQKQTLQEQVEAGKPIDVQENEDGSVDVNFDPKFVNPGLDPGHFANLAELIPDDILDKLGNEL